MQRILFDEFTVRTIRSVSTPTQIRWISRGTMTILKVEIIIPKSDLTIHAYRKINFVETLKKKIEKQMFDKFLCDIGIRSPNHSRLLFVKKLPSQNFDRPILRFLTIDRVPTLGNLNYKLTLSETPLLFFLFHTLLTVTYKLFSLHLYSLL